MEFFWVGKIRIRNDFKSYSSSDLILLRQKFSIHRAALEHPYYHSKYGSQDFQGFTENFDHLNTERIAMV
ncbi:unnamed protein product [Blumeria hordei]|uniref:Uncharacterized protein n=1 Tax=Blumeria hordei TaxID=2867405 RepID=A0A383URH2_BLUHO|nr:unnamed protein product [Blumeria hordei]